jgi:hypothetical protein
MLAAGTGQEDMIVVEDKRRPGAEIPAVVDRMEVAYMAHLQVGNRPAVGSATEDCLDSWNMVFDRSSTWFLSKNYNAFTHM